MDKLIDGIDRDTERASASEPDNYQRTLRLRSVTGVGPVISLGMSAILGRLPFKSPDAFVAYLASTRARATQTSIADGAS